MEQSITIQDKTQSIFDINESKYINLLTDYGLKSVLKESELAIDFLNDILNETACIRKISYLDKEITGKHKYQRTAIFDLLCEDDRNREFIVEIQRVHQDFFLDRSVYYASARIQDNAPKGEVAFGKWDFDQKPLIFIGILDFDMKGSQPDKYRYFVQLCDVDDKKVLYEKLSFIYLELPKFERLMGSDFFRESTNLNKWLYAIRNLHTLEKAPDFLNEGPFKKLLEIAEVANMTKEQKEEYDFSLKRLADEYATNQTSLRKGREEKAIEIIRNLLNMGKLSISDIAKAASVDEVYVLEIKSEMDNNEK